MTPWIILIISAGLLFFAVKTGISTYSWVSNAESIDGTVIELVPSRDKKSFAFAPRVAYLQAGKDCQFTSTQFSHPPDFDVGEKLKIVINAKTNEERIASFGQLYGFPLVLGLLAFLMGISVVIFMNGNRVLSMIHPNLG
jgi:hypothetical protein